MNLQIQKRCVTTYKIVFMKKKKKALGEKEDNKGRKTNSGGCRNIKREPK
jgi:hypothetical protein